MNVSTIKKDSAPLPPRQNALSHVRRGRISAPLRVLCYGAEGVGKSTFAAGAPRPLWLGAEGGTGHLDVDRLPEPKAWADVLSSLADVRREGHDYRTLVVDPLGWLEPLCWAQVTSGVGTIEQACGGYGKGYVAAHQLWRVMLQELDAIWTERSMAIVLLAHATIEQHPNPTGATWPMWQPALHKLPRGSFAQWVDHVLFAQVETVALKGEDKRTLGQATGVRVLHAAPSGGWLAKSRGLPDVMPLAWSSLVEAEDRATAMRAELAELLADMPEDYAAKARAAATQPGVSLEELVNKVRTKKESMK
jgi:hypothetical protein